MTPTLVFSCQFCEIFKNTFFIEHLQWLLLYMIHFPPYNNKKASSFKEKPFKSVMIKSSFQNFVANAGKHLCERCFNGEDTFNLN